MTIGAFVMILIAVHVATGWLLLIYVMNLYAGYPYWDLVMDMFWPVGTPALILLVAGILAQGSYLRKKRKGVPAQLLPATVPSAVYSLLLGLLLGEVAIIWFGDLFDSYSFTVATRNMEMPILLLVLSLLCFAVMVWLIKRKR